MQVTVQYAEEHFADLISAVNSGEDVEILQTEKPALKLVRTEAIQPVLKNGKRVLGAGRGELRVPGAEEWAAMDRELAARMNDTPIFPLEDDRER